MKNPWTLGSERVQISRPVLEWERQYKNVDGSEPDHVIYVNEGPQPLASPDSSLVHVIYSASGCWTPYYKLGCLTAPADADLLNPASWTKSSKPLFAQSPTHTAVHLDPRRLSPLRHSTSQHPQAIQTIRTIIRDINLPVAQYLRRQQVNAQVPASNV